MRIRAPKDFWAGLIFVAIGAVWTLFDSPRMSLRYLYYLLVP